LEVFKLALENDPAWAAKLRKRAGNEENLTIGKAGLLPVVVAQIRASRTDTDFGNSGSPDDCSLNSALDTFNTILGGLSGEPTVNEAIRLYLDEIANLEDNIREDFERTISGCFTQSETTSTQFGVTLTQPIFRLDRWYDYRLAKTLHNRGEIEFNQARQDLVLQTADLYFNYLRAKEEHEYTKLEAAAIQYQLDATKQRFLKGLTNRVNVFETQAIYDLTQAAAIAAESALDSAYEDLATLTNTYTLELAPLPNNILVEHPSPASVEKWIEFTRRFNPEIQLAEIGLMAAKQDHQRKFSAHAPTVDFLASYSRTDNGDSAAIDLSNATTTAFGVGMNIPLYAGGGVRGARKQAKHKEFEMNDLLTKVYQDTSNATRKLFRKVNTGVLAVRAQQVAINSNKAALTAITQGFERGTRTAAEVLQGQRDLYNARKQFTNAKYDYILDTLRLKRVTGTLTESDLNILNTWLLEPTAGIDTSDPEPIELEQPGVFEEPERKVPPTQAPIPRTSAEEFEQVPEPTKRQKLRSSRSLFEALQNL